MTGGSFWNDPRPCSSLNSMNPSPGLTICYFRQRNLPQLAMFSTSRFFVTFDFILLTGSEFEIQIKDLKSNLEKSSLSNQHVSFVNIVPPTPNRLILPSFGIVCIWHFLFLCSNFQFFFVIITQSCSVNNNVVLYERCARKIRFSH